MLHCGSPEGDEMLKPILHVERRMTQLVTDCLVMHVSEITDNSTTLVRILELDQMITSYFCNLRIIEEELLEVHLCVREVKDLRSHLAGFCVKKMARSLD